MASASPPNPDTTAPAAAANSRPWGLALLWLLPVLVVALILAYGALTRMSDEKADNLPQVGQPLADFALTDLQGNTVQLSALRGNVVFINVWATWCQPCIDEMPTIERLYNQLHARGLEVVTISLDPLGAQVIEPFMRRYRLTFPVLLDVKSQVERLYGTTGVPESFIVDKRGRLVEKVVGPRDWSSPQMLALFERLMAMPAPQSQG
jgi:peroxiredoxin